MFISLLTLLLLASSSVLSFSVSSYLINLPHSNQLPVTLVPFHSILHVHCFTLSKAFLLALAHLDFIQLVACGKARSQGLLGDMAHNC